MFGLISHKRIRHVFNTFLLHFTCIYTAPDKDSILKLRTLALVHEKNIFFSVRNFRTFTVYIIGLVLIF